MNVCQMNSGLLPRRQTGLADVRACCVLLWGGSSGALFRVPFALAAFVRYQGSKRPRQPDWGDGKHLSEVSRATWAPLAGTSLTC